MSRVTDRPNAPEAEQPQATVPRPPRYSVVEAIALGVGVLVILGLIAWYTGIFSGSEEVPQPPEVVAPIADGTHFAMVTVGTDDSGEVTLGVDLAEMLGGEEARQAAIEDGVIGEGEDLPNDFYIRNPENVYELMHFGDSVDVTMISAVDPGSTLQISPTELLAIYSGDKVDDTIYGVVVGQPIAMNLTVFNGEVVQAEAVYLP